MVSARKSAWSAMLCVCLGVVGAPRAHASAITYNSAASFLAAAGGGLASANFTPLSGDLFQTLSSVQPSIAPGVTFSSTGGTGSDLFVAPANFGGDSAIAVPSLFANFFGTPLIATFSPDVTAVGSALISFGSSATITVAVRNADSTVTDYSVTPGSSSAAYFGIIATGGSTIASISYGPPAGFTAGVNDFQFGQAEASAVPEPTSLVLLGTGLLVGMRKWRKERRQQTDA